MLLAGMVAFFLLSPHVSAGVKACRRRGASPASPLSRAKCFRFKSYRVRRRGAWDHMVNLRPHAVFDAVMGTTPGEAVANSINVALIQYPALLELSLGVFKCNRYSSNESYLHDDPSVRCSGARWSTLRVFAGLTIPVAFAAPKSLPFRPSPPPADYPRSRPRRRRDARTIRYSSARRFACF